MLQNHTADNRSPWYEPFAPSRRQAPAVFVKAEARPKVEVRPVPAKPAEAPDADWATEALFNYYNG